MTEEFPVLYILMRDDLGSMNPGKAMAQASHASNAFWKTINDKFLDKKNDDITRLANMWQLETNQGFGTVLVLAVNEATMREVVIAARKLNYLSDIIHDPTYPLVDGDVVHYLPIDTCAYVFIDKNDPMTDFLLGDLPLHP